MIDGTPYMQLPFYCNEKLGIIKERESVSHVQMPINNNQSTLLPCPTLFESNPPLLILSPLEISNAGANLAVRSAPE